MRTLNRLLGLFGVALVPRKSVKMLIEYGNTLESFHPSRTGAARWVRHVARVMPLDDVDKGSRTVQQFLAGGEGGT